MNPIAKEIASYLGSAEMSDEEFIQHYGMPRRSGRYPWGSGEDPYQHDGDFLSRVEQLKSKGWKETPENIKKEFGLTTTKYRMEKSICADERKAYVIATAKSLKQDGLNNSEIARKMKVNESTVRGWFEQEQKSRYTKARETADFLKKQIKEKRMIDVGKDVEGELGISKEKLNTALYLLEREGYHVYEGRMPQPTNPSQMTTNKVLCAKDVQHKEIFDYDKIKNINEYKAKDDGSGFEKKFHYPESMDSKRIKVVLRDEIGPDGLTGVQQDGLIQIRRGCPDLDLQGKKYAQVRILVDGDKYIKGMAVYSDKMPDGYDLVFNSNKTDRKDAFKSIKNDPENPFGSNIKETEKGGQYWYNDPKTGQRKLGLINKRSDEGDWTEWSNALPSQFLSKQSRFMAEKQLNLAKADKQAEFDEIMQLNNPTIKKYYLKKFADSCDSAAVELKAAALPQQRYHVIVPINTLKDDEVYAPQYKPGTKLALIRYPHAGTFEIPILTVTDKNPQGKRVIGTDSIDAVGITAKVAARLSGADFDGDTVMCIPTHDRQGRVKITSTKPLKGLEGFDPQLEYKYDKVVTDKNGNKHYYRAGREYKPINDATKQNEMGKISNLISDMTLAGASEDELARAVRHSMVTIDAEKHKLDIRSSFRENNIEALQKKYQPKFDANGNLVGWGGAHTIISKAKGEVQVPRRRGEGRVNIKGKPWYDPSRPEGSLIYLQAEDKLLYRVDSSLNKKTGLKTVKLLDGGKVEYDPTDPKARKKYTPTMQKDKNGNVYFTNPDGTIKYKTKIRTQNSTRMAETDDATSLVSSARHPMEMLYVDYANSMKALANKARLEIYATGNLKYNPTANKIYKAEVESLENKLKEFGKNRPKERAATRYALTEINKLKETNPDITNKDLKKMSQRYMTKYRQEVGSIKRSDRNIKITDREWEAIQAGAISENKLKNIISNSDPDSLRARAMPKNRKTVSTAQINRMKALANSNFTLTQIAEKMNLSPSAVSKYIRGVE